MKIAIIGSGISGLGAAYLLNPHHDITVYEQSDTPGGHSRTVEIQTAEGSVPVDTGFIVFNHLNYPLLTRLFEHLQVPTAKSDMSFGVSIDDGWLEYGTCQWSGLFAQAKNLIRPQYWHMLRDIMRFNREARNYLQVDNNISLKDCLDKLGMGRWFRQYYLLAMGGAIWSTPIEKMLEFPAKTFLRFFDNHGLLTVNDQPQWYTVQGGSREYVKRLTATFADKIRLECGVASVTRQDDGVLIEDANSSYEHYDQVIFACHSDQALNLLRNPTQQEKGIIGAIRYQPNEAVLHRDINLMPRRKRAWSSWVYLSQDQKDENGKVSLSYWMNNLQPLATQTPVIVTLNPGIEPQDNLVYDRHWFEHPVFDEVAIDAQDKIPEIQGKDRIWYCGAWQRYGFHEDGLWSAVRVAKELGAELPWK